MIAPLALIFGVCFALVLFLPLPETRDVGKETYECTWQDGSVSRLNYAEAYSALSGITEQGVVLARGDLTGEIAGGAEFCRAAQILRTGSLARLLSLEAGDALPLERAALYRVYGNRGWYAGEFFAFDGTRVFRTSRAVFNEVALLSGNLPAGVLRVSGADKLVVFAEAKLSANALVGSNISEAEAAYPYSSEDGGIYLHTAGGKRLVAALPKVKSLRVNSRFIDEGALSPCQTIEELILPRSYAGTLAMLFGGPVPETLKTVIYEEIP